MKGETVAILENRLGEQLVELVAKRGGRPLHAPALAEIPDIQPPFIRALLADWRAAPVAAAIFQTGVGTRALFKATDELGLTAELLSLLAGCTVVARGPKPAGPLKSRGVRIDRSAAAPYTTAEVVAELAALDLSGARVVVQRYGGRNLELENHLKARGAALLDIPLYRWAMPEDTRPLVELIDALGRHAVAAVVFTSASQAHNLFEFARGGIGAEALAARLNASCVASIGPVCSAALAQYGVEPRVEASPPKLGPLLEALDAALAQGG